MAPPRDRLDPELERVLTALDAAPQAIPDLADRLDLTEQDVDDVLARGGELGYVAYWGPEFVTTWKAKWVLHPRFFQRAVPGSVAAGLAVTALALWWRAPDATGAAAVTAAVAAALAVYAGTR